MKLLGLVPNSYIHVSESDLYIPQTGPPILLEPNSRLILQEYINHSQIHECGSWETECYNSVLEIARPRSLFLGIYQSEPDIYIGF